MKIKLNPSTIDKVCPICNKNFTISFYLRNRRTYCSKKCANHDPRVIEKIKQSQKNTFLEKYGMHPMKTEKTKENLKKSIKGKYGVEWISQKNGWYESIKQNNLKKYGTKTYTNSIKRLKTFLKKYGVKNPSQIDEVRNKIIQTKLNKHYNYLIKYCNDNNITLLFHRQDYKGYNFENKYKFQCKKCNYIFESSINNTFNHIYCEKCDPNKKKTLENDFFDFLSSLNPLIIKRHDRTILYGKELDFYLPDKKIAIELNGLYWHSENSNGKSKYYHLNKTKACISHGIRLIHIFENEWRDKPEIIKSMLNNILHNKKNINIISLDDCLVKVIKNNKIKNEFLENNSLEGKDKSNIKLGLYYNEKLISIMTFLKCRYNKNQIYWKLSRYCKLNNILIKEDSKRLFFYFIKNYNPELIIAYNNRRYFSGNFYVRLGFSFISNSSPSYHYITPDYKCIFNRLNFQKHLLSKKLNNFDSKLSEWDNMKNNGWDRIWDCGCSKWIWKFST